MSRTSVFRAIGTVTLLLLVACACVPVPESGDLSFLEPSPDRTEGSITLRNCLIETICIHRDQFPPETCLRIVPGQQVAIQLAGVPNEGFYFRRYDDPNDPAAGPWISVSDWSSCCGRFLQPDGTFEPCPSLTDCACPGIDGITGDAVADGGNGTASAIQYDDFANMQEIVITGSATRSGDALRLTSAGHYEAGAAWYAEPQFLSTGFSTDWSFRITNPGGSFGNASGDGFAFVIQGEGTNALGASGGGKGYQGIPNSVAIDFDTALNTIGPNPYPRHITVQSRGTEPNSSDHAFALGYTDAIPDITDGQPHTARIGYVPGQLEVFLDDLQVPVMSVSLDLASLLDLPDGSAWVGFAAGTGEAYEEHDILSWQFSSNSASD